MVGLVVEVVKKSTLFFQLEVNNATQATICHPSAEPSLFYHPLGKHEVNGPSKLCLLQAESLPDLLPSQPSRRGRVGIFASRECLKPRF
jgi:hypothetical protein